jgi:hypothetical protein
MTGDPFQPVRIYYSIPDRAFVTRKLRKLACMDPDPRDGCWQWLFEGEAASLRFATGIENVPVERRPIILGRFRFPKRDAMTFEANAIQRAIEGARFFGPRLGPQVLALRCRVVNRWFTAGEGSPGELMKTLDRNVTVIDPRETEVEVRRAFADVRTTENAERAMAEEAKRWIESRPDVPEVEDFPLYPEEETPDFQTLSTCLLLRHHRAFEHWRGNTHLTLAAIIARLVKEGMRSERRIDGP